MNEPEPPPSPSPIPVPSYHLFHRHKVQCILDGQLSIFDYNLQNALVFSQGSWSLIHKDLLHAGVHPASIQALEDGPCREIINAFRIRRELIHYKKVCLHLFDEAKKIERELKQVMAFFFWDDSGVWSNGRGHDHDHDHDHGDDDKDQKKHKRRVGSRAHLEAICALAPSDLKSISPMDLPAVQSAMHHHRNSETCQLIHRKILHVVAAGAWTFNKGVSIAIYDARNVAKAICMSPRHPDGEKNGERPERLVNLPGSMNVAAALDKENLSGQGLQKSDGTECESQGAKGSRAMQRILDKVRDDLHWPAEAMHFLSLSIAARGGFKALAIVEELQHYNACISAVPGRLKEVLELHKDSHSDLVDLVSECGLDDRNVAEDLLSGAVPRLGKIHNLNGMLKACGENAKWVAVIASLCSDTNTCEATPTSTVTENDVHDGNGYTVEQSQLFVAGDDARSNNTCLFVPKGFQLGNFIALSRDLLDKVLLPTMNIAIASESWPPRLGSLRTRVIAYEEIAVKSLPPRRKPLHVCNGCKGHFDSTLWIRQNLCYVCEGVKRNNVDLTQCLFEDCKFRDKAFCPHFKRCFVCDSPHSCEKLCRLSRGDGEAATALVETIQPRLLLLDFDRTLASTRSGASPLPKKGHPHSIDGDLKVAVTAQKAYGSSHVVTRNSHKSHIEEFLVMHGLEELAKNVHVVPKKKTKGSFIKETFFSEGPQTSIFIDDDIRELVKDPWLKNCDHIHRLLFVRAFLK
jgi:hypothetical protein